MSLSIDHDAQNVEDSQVPGLLYPSILTSKPLGEKPKLRQRADFKDKFRTECIDGSAIAPELFEAAITFIEDTGRWEPNHALNEKVSTQYQTRKPHDYGTLAAFVNEDCSLWTGKAEKPRREKDGTHRRYQTPTGNDGTIFFKPTVPIEIRRKVGQRYGLDIPETGSFWDWVAATPGLVLIHTEGGKKALSLLSDGHIPVGLYGIWNGCHKVDGKPQLSADIAAFCHPSTTHVIGFDRDSKPSAVEAVAIATPRYGRLLAASGGAVRVATWDGAKGKGIDDLAVAAGRAAVDAAIASAVSLKEIELEKVLANRLTRPAQIGINSPDISGLQIAGLPDTGIIAIASPKGTGKTNFISNTILGTSKALLLGHRIALMRNLCQRLAISYREDLARHQGRYMDSDGFTLRVGSCVDSLLAINPQDFTGCDLVIDEICQVLRHLLTSQTCNKADSFRVVLLKRLTDVMKAAKRLIVADADLDNSILKYLQTLTGQETFLIRNDFKPTGYPVRFIESKDRSQVVAELKKDIQAELRVYVATDSIKESKAIAKILRRMGVDLLLINSDTSGLEAQQAFITDPDNNLNYQVIVASPSLGTGVSIERKYFDKVYGIFRGGASTDGDIAQALGRVRDNIPRVIWCAKRGSNFCQVSDSVYPSVIKKALMDQTLTTIALINAKEAVRSQLNVATDTLNSFNWDDNPHLELWAQVEADKNRSMHDLRAALLTRLRHEGNQVEVVEGRTVKQAKAELKIAREQVKEEEATELFNAENLTEEAAKPLENEAALKPEARAALKKWQLANFYAIEPADLTREDIELDNEGRFRGQLLNLIAQTCPERAIATVQKSIQQQEKTKEGFTPWDFSDAEIKRQMRQILGLEKYMDADSSWTKHDLNELEEKLKTYRSQVKAALNFTYKDSIPIAQALGFLLGQMGLKTTSQKSRKVPGHEGEEVRVYRLDAERWEKCQAIMGRLSLKFGFETHTPSLEIKSTHVSQTVINLHSAVWRGLK
jgi:hypothetical protein